jgi:hypothetical protein
MSAINNLSLRQDSSSAPDKRRPYSRFNEVRKFLDDFENLFLVGRNGMHKYNNQDHSMLTAMLAVDNIAAGITEVGSSGLRSFERKIESEIV